MILPTKHLAIEDSLIGSGAVMLQELTGPQSVSRLWDKLRIHPSIGNYTRFSLTLDFLFMIGSIKIENNLILKAGDQA